MQFASPRQRKKHLRVFQGKIRRYRTTYLKKLRDELWDRWTWETGADLDKKKAEMVEEEIKGRHGSEYRYTELMLAARHRRKHKSQQKKRKTWRDGFKLPDLRGHIPRGF